MDWDERQRSLTERAFRRRYKVSKMRFHALCEELTPQLKPGPTTSSPISVQLRLSMTLRYLCGAHPYDIVDMHGCGESTFYHILVTTLVALNDLPSLKLPDILRDDQLREQVSGGFAAASGGALSGCCGAIDGLAVRIVKPKNTPNASAFYCRKGFFAVNVRLVPCAHSLAARTLHFPPTHHQQMQCLHAPAQIIFSWESPRCWRSPKPSSCGACSAHRPFTHVVTMLA